MSIRFWAFLAALQQRPAKDGGQGKRCGQTDKVPKNIPDHCQLGAKGITNAHIDVIRQMD